MELLCLSMGREEQGWVCFAKSAFCHSGLLDLGLIKQPVCCVVLWTLFQARNPHCQYANAISESSPCPALVLFYLFSINRHFAPWLLLGATHGWAGGGLPILQYLPFSMNILVTLSPVLLVFSRVIKGLFFSPQNCDKSTSVPKPNYQTWLECKKGRVAFLSLPKGQARVLFVRDFNDLKLPCLPSQKENLSEQGIAC